MSTGADAQVARDPATALAGPATSFDINVGGRRLSGGTLALTGGLLVLAALWMVPLFWILLTAIKPEPEIIRLPVHFLPEEMTLANVQAALTTSRTANIAVAFANSTIVAIAETVLTLAIDSMAAYALARLTFRGRSIVFGVIIASIMVPLQITLVPLYMLFQQAGWLSSYQALILPGLSRAFGVFLLWQFILGIPKELEDAARIDGAGIFTIFRQVSLPLVQPAMASLAIFTFLRSWNEFPWPLIVVFFIFQRQIVQGIALTGLKE